MATIKPFAGYRPAEQYAFEVAALPYDVYNREEATAEVSDKPLSFLRVDRAETTLDKDIDMYDERVYQKALENIRGLIDDGILVKEEKPVYYLYELTRDGHVQTGLVATCSVDEYLDGQIRRHELTRPEKEEDRVRHIDTLDMDTGPIYLFYKNDETVSGLIDEAKKKGALYDFKTDDGIRHRVFRVDDFRLIEELTKRFSEIDRLYMADGHHRCASTVRVAQKRRRNDSNPTGNKAYDYFLSVIFPDEELTILDYNRVVSDLNGLSEGDFLEKLGEVFRISPSEEAVRPEKKGVFGMYLGGRWYRLEYNGELPEDSVDRLDVSILNETVLEPILGIEDIQTDSRIGFVGGVRGLEELSDRVDEGMAVAFSLYPTQIQELVDVADQNRLMPPKSTWFEPKLRSGLFIYPLG